MLTDKQRASQRRWRENHPDRHKASVARWREKNAERYLAYAREYQRQHRIRSRDKRFQDKYGITLDDYERLYEQQKGRCAVCGDPSLDRLLAVDHDHVTGRVRGLLCANCNLGIGNFKDDVSRLTQAICYLERERDGLLSGAPVSSDACGDETGPRSLAAARSA
jgi:hypothetical protein